MNSIKQAFPSRYDYLINLITAAKISSIGLRIAQCGKDHKPPSSPLRDTGSFFSHEIMANSKAPQEQVEKSPFYWQPSTPASKSPIPQSTLALFFLSIAAAILACLPALKHLTDLYLGKPITGQLGWGHHLIRGVTVPFEYPFRLAQSSIWSHLVPWICYVVHQSGHWYLISQARSAHSRGELKWTPAGQLNPYAHKMLVLNGVMVLMHFLVSRFNYNGLCSSFSEISTLVAGVTSLVVVMMFEGPRRGWAFGCDVPSKTWSESLKRFAGQVKHYHGYMASFGIIVTFWYHPFEATLAHFTGWTHMMMLIVQSSLIYQNQHRDRYWTAIVEVWIMVHGTTVAYFQGYMSGELYSMFATSFLMLFAMSTAWGLPIVQRFLSTKESWRYYAVFGAIVALYAPVAYFFLIGRTWWLPFLTTALPMLYYGLSLWYYVWFLYGSYFQDVLKGWGFKRPQVFVGTLVSVLAIGVMMALVEFVYRQFFPYQRLHSKASM
jgi:hypothetical protein